MARVNLQPHRDRFKTAFPDFGDFENPGEQYLREEDWPKRESSAKVKAALQPFIEESREFANDQEAKSTLMPLIRAINVMDWRGAQDVEEFGEETGRWKRFGDLLTHVIRNSHEYELWKEPLDSLLIWMRQVGCKAFLVKAVPSYFLMMWNPRQHLFFKSSKMKEFLDSLGMPMLQKGQYLSAELYRDILGAMTIVRENLADLRPRDFIDLQGFVFVTAEKKHIPLISGAAAKGKGPLAGQTIQGWNQSRRPQFIVNGKRLAGAGSATTVFIYDSHPLGSAVVRHLEQAGCSSASRSGGTRVNVPRNQFVALVTDTVTQEQGLRRKPDVIASDAPDLPLNLILCGPPGTGKTHRLLTEVIPQFEQRSATQSQDDFIREAVQGRTWSEVTALALALCGGSARVSNLANTSVVTASAESRKKSGGITNQLWATLQSGTPDDCPHVRYARRSEPRIFWKNEDSSWRFTDDAREQVPEIFELAEQIRNFKPRSVTKKRYEMVTFHQSYAYEDFVEGIKPVVASGAEGAELDGIHYVVTPGIFQRLVTAAMKDPEANFALFIDEINRGNISNIFGELITLIEPGKRMRWDPAAGEAGDWVGGVRLKLPYTHSADPTAPLFGVPDNLWIVGTMNTADRSIALLDLALRRRFDFEELYPEPELLKGGIETEEGTIDLARMLTVMNERIEYLIDRDHMIGHAYLMRPLEDELDGATSESISTLDELDAVFRHRIIPLLQEYFYGDWQRIQMVLRDLIDSNSSGTARKLHPDAFVEHRELDPKALFGLDDDAYEKRKVYQIAEEFSARSFLKIYDDRYHGLS